jgi:rare lipoprotein A (peptidoglycan hydrolase)
MNRKYHARSKESDFLCHPEPQVKNVLVYRPTIRVVYMSMLAALLLCAPSFAESFTTQVSYYTVESCKREGTSGICANGERLVDYGRCIAASWDFPFGTRIRVTRVDRPDLSIICEVADRGPSKRLYRKGRRLDVNAEVAKRLGFIKNGLAICTVERLKGE